MTDAVIDRRALARLLEVVGGDFDFLREMIGEFDATAPDLVAEMHRAASARDMVRLRISAHTLKSNAREFGATALSALCERLEHGCRDRSLEAPAPLLTEISRELETARSALAGIDLEDE